jgi:hypothetical protein
LKFIRAVTGIILIHRKVKPVHSRHASGDRMAWLNPALLNGSGLRFLCVLQ